MVRTSIRRLSAALISSLCLAAVLAGGTVLAQGPVSATVDRTRLALDEQLTLSVSISGGGLNITSPDLSALEGFDVVGSSTSSQIIVTNGQVTSQAVFHYLLQPRQTGALVIAPVTVNLGGQVYQTEPIEIEVFPANPRTSPPQRETPPPDQPRTLAGQDYFVEAEVDNPAPYVGQQIVYTFRLYQAVDFRFRPDYDAPAFTNFWHHALESPPPRTITSDTGRNYLVTERRTALFPATPGLLTIEPAQLSIPGGFFEPDVRMTTEPVTVEVRSLPPGAPPDFSGAVGQFNLSARFDQAEGAVGEPLTLVVEIDGTGNISTLPEPALPELPGWRVFDSQARISLNREGDRIGGQRRFERLLVPAQAGDQVFPALSFTYFDPEAQTYRTAQSDPIPITIRPAPPGGEGAAAPPGSAADLQNSSSPLEDIRHIKPVPPGLSGGRPSLLGNPLYWAGWLAPALGLAGLWLWQNRRQRLLTDVAYARRLRARRAAEQILARAGQPGADPNALVQQALTGYLSDRLNQPVTGLTAERMAGLLRESGLPPNLIAQVQELLVETDIGRFAPVGAGPAATEQRLAAARRLISDLEQAFPAGGRR